MRLYSIILGMYPFFSLANTFLPFRATFFCGTTFFCWLNFLLVQLFFLAQLFFVGATFFCWHDFFSGATFFVALNCSIVGSKYRHVSSKMADLVDNDQEKVSSI